MAKRVLVTGGNKGIGFAICKALVERGCFVFMGSRSLELGRAAVASLPEGAAASIEVVQIDVTDPSTIDHAIATVKARCDADGVPLGGLINNAGIALAFGHTSHKDLVDTVKVNFEGLVQCTQSFLPLLQDGGDKDPRIVMVSSAAGPNFVAKCDHSKKALLTNPAVRLDQLHALVAEVLLVSQQHDEAGTSPIAAFEAMGMSDFNPYGFSKALVNAYAMYAARQHPDVVINSCTPGMIDTDLSRNAAKKLGKDVKDWGAKSPEHGAKCPVYIMLDELPTPRGEAWFYGSDCVRSPLHKYRNPGDPPFDGNMDEDALSGKM